MTEGTPGSSADLKYEPIEHVPAELLASYVASGDAELIRKALYSASSYGSDWKWAQDQCLHFIRSEHRDVRWAATQVLGELAFLGHPIEIDRVIPALNEAMKDPDVAGEADMSLDLVKHAFGLE